MSTVLREYFPNAITKKGVDREAGLIRDAVVCTAQSKNGRGYKTKALNSIAELLKKNPRAYINHTSEDKDGNRQPPGLFDLGGRWENVRVNIEQQKVIGDLRPLASHKEQIFALAEEAPDLFGTSIYAQGELTRDKDTGADTVEDINHLWSADLVAEPAATTNLFESIHTDNKKEKTMCEECKKLTEQLDFIKRERDCVVKEAEGYKAQIAAGKREGEIKAELEKAGLDAGCHLRFVSPLSEELRKEYIDTQKKIIEAAKVTAPPAPAPKTVTTGNTENWQASLEAAYN